MQTQPQSALARFPEAGLETRGEGYYEVEFFALGSECQIFFDAVDEAAAVRFRGAACAWLTQFEERFSRFRPESEVSRVNRCAGIAWCEIGPDFEALLALCDHAHFVTRGAFDATSHPLTALWDWKRKHDVLPADHDIDKAKKCVGWNRVQRAPGRIFLPEAGMLLDLGGVGKEFAVDCLRQLAASMGVEHAMINLGGDIAVVGDSPEGGGWYVGLEDPAAPGACFCGVRLPAGAAVATSGNYRRRFLLGGRSYGHILDCRTGRPVETGTACVTVLGPRCTAAGLLATSAMVLAPLEAVALLDRTMGVEGCLWNNGKLYETRHFRRYLHREDPVSVCETPTSP